jgi:hypothetical protein
VEEATSSAEMWTFTDNISSASSARATHPIAAPLCPNGGTQQRKENENDVNVVLHSTIAKKRVVEKNRYFPAEGRDSLFSCWANWGAS